MKITDLTIIAFQNEKEGVITGYIRSYPGIIAVGKDEEEIRKKLFTLYYRYQLDELVKLKDAEYKLTIIKSN